MATKMGFPPGVRIQLRDNSAYEVVENPYTTAGIVGYASKGELNKIIQVNDTGELGSKLGYGYQQAKYNQGMYAARAVLDAGGVVEFVRPYGEEISKTDPFKRDLKTDTFVVAYDKSGVTGESINMKYFASTRYKSDGAAGFGVTRKINNIAETVSSGSNVDFNLSASETFVESAECRSPVDMVLFAIMNRDPSNAYRAFDRYEMKTTEFVKVVDQETQVTTTTLQCTLDVTPGFVVGEKVFLPVCDGNAVPTEAEVTAIDGKDITLSVTGDDFVSKGKPAPTVLVYCSAASAIEDGYDYLNVRTAVAGQTVKTFNAIKWGSIDNQYVDGTTIPCGTAMTFRDKNGSEYVIRFFTKTGEDTATVTVESGKATVAITAPAKNVVEPGDTIILSSETKGLYVATVDYIDAAGLHFAAPSGMEGDTYTLTISELSEDDLVANVVGATSWKEVADAVVKTLVGSGLGYNNNPVANDIESFDSTDKKVIVDVSASFEYSIGDQVAIVRRNNSYVTPEQGETSPADADAILWFGEVEDVNTRNGELVLKSANPFPTFDDETVYQLLNLKTSSFSVYNAVSTVGGDDYTVTTTLNPNRMTYTVDGNVLTITKIEGIDDLFADTTVLPPTAGSQFILTNVTLRMNDGTTKNVGDITLNVTTIGTDNTDPAATFKYALVRGFVDAGAEIDPTVPISSTGYTEFETEKVTKDTVYTYLVSSYSMYVSKADQGKAPVDSLKVGETTIAAVTDCNSKDDAKYTTTIVEKSPKVLAESDIGASFMALGLAKTDYLDIDFTGEPRQVYVLTDDGENIARMFLAVTYRYNGTVYEFEGTIVPYLYNGIQLDIRDAAEYELTNSGLEFVINDSGILDYFLENISYDLSQTVKGGILNGSTTCISYNEEDPAIKNDAVWTYNPLNNNSGSTLSTVWNLFVNKDGSDVDMLVSAGMNINNPFMKNIETLNTQVMQAMLNVCEARKDCFCLFDSPAEAKIATALKKDIVATGFGSTHGRWGMMYDGRGVFFDSIYTHSNVDIMKSVQLASIITSNRQSGIYWLPPSGYDYAPVPSAWGTKEKYLRTYNSEDKNCDIGKLSDIHVNATRSNKEGLFIWGDFTLQMENTAFNQAHVTMLVAGIHKSFYKYLDHKVFRLNTTNLRAQITSDLQGRLNSIMTANPQGLINGKVICDDSNNTPDLIDQNFLIVDLKLLPPKSSRWIILRTEVESTKNGNKISTTLIA